MIDTDLSMSVRPAVDTRQEIERLCSFERRAPGTNAERRAAEFLRRRLEELGREASLEPISTFPNYPLTFLLHALVAIAGSVIAVSDPLIGTVALAVVTASAAAELLGRFPLARRLTGMRASQNVVSREHGGKPGTLVLVAHYDSARAASMLGGRAARRRARAGRLLRRPIGAFEPFFWSIVVVLACAALRLGGIEGTALTIVQFIPTVVLIVSVPLLVDAMLAPVVPGANDNASGVAAVLALAGRYGGRLEHLDVWVLLTGAGEGMLSGAREFLRAHRGELDPVSTAFVCIEAVGSGSVRYSTKEGELLGYRYHPALLECCEQLAPEHGASAIATRTPSDAHVARTRGFPAISVSCADDLGLARGRHQVDDTPDRIDDAALERALEFASDVVELIDARVGSRLD